MTFDAAHEAGEGGRLLNYPVAHVFRPPRGQGSAIGAAVAAVVATAAVVAAAWVGVVVVPAVPQALTTSVAMANSAARGRR